MHCPQCGKPVPAQAVACHACGSPLDPPAGGAGGPREMARTVMGVAQAPGARAAEARGAEGRERVGTPGPHTVVGLPPVVQLGKPNAPIAQTSLGLAPPASPDEAGAPARALRTQIGFSAPGTEGGARGPSPVASAAAPQASQASLPRDARSGPRADASPLPSTLTSSPERGGAPAGRRDARGGNGRERGANGHEQPPHELGATVVNQIEAARVPAKRLKAHAIHIPRPVPPTAQRRAAKQNQALLKVPKVKGDLRDREASLGSRGALLIVVAAGLLAAGAVLFVVLWPGRSPLSARPATDTQGREGIEIACKSCPDGTSLAIDALSAQVSGGSAFMALGKPLAAGENRFKVRVDRPKGRDEIVPLSVRLPYRIRPELSTLQGERPAIQVVVEAAPGSRVALDGKPVPLVGGRAVEAFDVIEACTGLTGEPRSLSRQIPYVVTPKDGEPERGSVNVMVGIVPLEIDAPGSSVVIDGPSFVLAGRTMKGAELLAAGKPVPVKPDGSFAHVMNVSSVGATQIEVRAKLAGMAPRLTRIKVRRVDNLETAAREFAAESPIQLAPLGSDIGRFAGKPIAIGGQVIEVKRENHRTTMLVDVGPSAGCKGCSVQLVQGANNPAQPGEKLTAYGRVLRAVRLPSGAEIPEIEVDFTLKGLK